MNKIRGLFYLTLVFLMTLSMSSRAQVVGDFGAISSGNWSTPGIWRLWNGTSFSTATGAYPNNTNWSVFIDTNRVVVLDVPAQLNDLWVSNGAKLYSNDSTLNGNVYITLFGNIYCNATIGNGVLTDNISFNIEGTADTISGIIGTFDASRIRKNNVNNLISSLNIRRNVNLRFGSSSSTQIYNNAGSAGPTSTTNFNVTVASGSTLSLIGNSAVGGNASIDGVDGTGAFNQGGVFTIDGSMNISGRLYLTTNNTTAAQSCKWIVNGLLKADRIIASPSGIAKDSLIVNPGGTLEISGDSAWVSLSPTNNFYNFNTGSTVNYSSSSPTGNQTVRIQGEFAAAATASQQYSNLILSGSGNKTTSIAGAIVIKNNLTISGSCILKSFATGAIITVGGDWSNYNETGYNEQTNLVFFSGTTATAQNITCPGGEVFYTLRYANTATGTLIFNSPVDVISLLQFANNGPIDLNSNTLTIRNSTTAGINNTANPSRYIVSEKTNNSSKVKWKIGTSMGTYTIPFGTLPLLAANYIPVKVAKTNASDIGDVTIATYGTARGNLPWPVTPIAISSLNSSFTQTDDSDAVIDRFWYFNAINPVATDLTLTYRASELAVAPYNVTTEIRGQWYDGVAGNWQLPVPLGQTIGANFITIPATTSYGVWALVNINSPLPIKLLEFNAESKDEVVQVRWSTASEINNDYFTVEKSTDGEYFIETGKVRGAGNSSITLNYSLIDEHPLEGISYYRLKQTDFDGHFTFSRIVSVIRLRNQQFSVFPNPSRDIMYLASAAKGRYQLLIRNMEGKLIHELEVNINPAEIARINISQLSQGIYSLEIKNDYSTQTLRVIKN